MIARYKMFGRPGSRKRPQTGRNRFEGISKCVPWRGSPTICCGPLEKVWAGLWPTPPKFRIFPLQGGQKRSAWNISGKKALLFPSSYRFLVPKFFFGMIEKVFPMGGPTTEAQTSSEVLQKTKLVVWVLPGPTDQ